jgi:hypothetical protein
LGYAYRFAGMLTQSLGECRKARQIDPSVKSNGSVLNTYLYSGQYEEFLTSLPDVSESAFFRLDRGFWSVSRGKRAASQRRFRSRLCGQPDSIYRNREGLCRFDRPGDSDRFKILGELESKIRQRRWRPGKERLRKDMPF